MEANDQKEALKVAGFSEEFIEHYNIYFKNEGKSYSDNVYEGFEVINTRSDTSQITYLTGEFSSVDYVL